MNSEDQALTETMLSYWTNFAKTGNPNGKGLPVWPEYDLQSDVWLELNHDIKRISGLRSRKLDILEENLNYRIDAIVQSMNPRDLIDDTTLLSSAAVSPDEQSAANSN